MQFQVTAEEHDKIQTWLTTVIYPPIVAKQLQNPITAPYVCEDIDGIKYPYMGAIGGGLTYTFSPTGLGMVFKVSHMDVDGKEQTLDLTEYDMW